MRLLTQSLVNSLPVLGSESEAVLAMFFNPCGEGIWWVTEGAVRDGDEQYSLIDYCVRYALDAISLETWARAGMCEIVFFGAAEAPTFELGTFSLSELIGSRGHFPLDVERDLEWKAIPLSRVQELREAVAS